MNRDSIFVCWANCATHSRIACMVERQGERKEFRTHALGAKLIETSIWVAFFFALEHLRELRRVLLPHVIGHPSQWRSVESVQSPHHNHDCVSVSQLSCCVLFDRQWTDGMASGYVSKTEISIGSERCGCLKGWRVQSILPMTPRATVCAG